MIKFYFHPSPNPLKIALYLEETGEPYELIPVDTRKGEQHTDGLALHPLSWAQMSGKNCRMSNACSMKSTRVQRHNARRP